MKIESSDPPVILLHPGKTGGTSIEHTLKDIYLPKGFKLISKQENFELMFGFSGEYKIYLQHADLRLYKMLNVDLEKYKTITTVRRPYERILSCYYYNAKDKLFSFEDFILDHLKNHIEINNKKGYYANHFCPQSFFVELDDYNVDHIVKLENFKDGCEKAGIDVNYHYSKTTGTKKYKNYLDAYTKEMKDVVYDLYRRDFELLDYDR